MIYLSEHLLEDLPYPQSGDVVLFADGSIASQIIRWATKGQVSHSACVYDGVTLVEPLLKSFGMTVFTDYFDRVKEYRKSKKGRCWLLRLSGNGNLFFQKNLYKEFLWDIVEKRTRYAIWKALWSAFPTVRNRESLGRLFCSEIYAAAMEKAQAWPQVNSSEVTPSDLYRLNNWGEVYQLAGRWEELKGFNKLSFRRWSKIIEND